MSATTRSRTTMAPLDPHIASSSVPFTPLKHRTYQHSSSPPALDAALVTPLANSSLLENDSPLPSPPSISKPKDTHRAAATFSDLGHPEGSSLPHHNDENDLPGGSSRRQGSPTPAPGAYRNGRRSRSKERQQLHEHHIDAAESSARAAAAVLTETTNAPAALSRLQHLDSSKLGIRPSSSVATMRAGAASSAGSRSVSHGAPPKSIEPVSRNIVSLARSHHARTESGDSRASAATAVDDGPSRPASSQARRSREAVDGAIAEARRPRPAEQTYSSHRRTSDERPSEAGEQEYNGKLSGGSDGSSRTAASRGSSSPIPRDTHKPLGYSTPALPTGARSLRSSQTATVGRSAARTLKRYGPGEARPNHVRPARVMLTQGADESDGEDDEEPGVGVGASQPSAEKPASPAATAIPASLPSSRDNSGTARRGAPPIQSTSKYLDGLSLQATRGQETPRGSDGNAPRVTAAEERRSSLASLPQVQAEGLPDMQIGADDEDDVDAEENAAANAAGGRRPMARQQRVREGGAGDKENAASSDIKGQALRQAMGEVMKAKVPAPSESVYPSAARRAPPPPAAASERPLQPSRLNGPARAEPLAAAAKPVRVARATPPPSTPAAAPAPAAAAAAADEASSSTYQLDPRLAAEKKRLLDLNGWDPYVRAALDEAERQRRNGCDFGENMVGKPLSNRKETKFRGAKYLKVSRAGEGGFSTVFQVFGPVSIPTLDGGCEAVPLELQAHFAMKQVSLKRLEQSSRDELLQEAQLLESLAEAEESDKYVLRYFGHKHSGDTLKILMELGEMDFNTLLRTQHPLPRAALSEYWRQMLESVDFVHNAKLVHTDLKPANFLLVKGRIKLIDFGIAQKIPLGTIHISRDVIVGTPNYMAPEAIQKARRGGGAGAGGQQGGSVYKAGKPSDVWSLGCILYQMVYGRTPFAHISGDRKLEVITDPRHQIAFPAQRTLDEQRLREHQQQNGSSDADRSPPSSPSDLPPLEDLDEILLDCMRASLIYSASSRATIPQLLAHPFVRDDVTLSRAKLRSIVLRIQAYMQQGGLNEDNVGEMTERLMTNLQLDAWVPFAPAGATTATRS